MDAGFPPRDQPPARPPADHAAGGRGRPNRGEINDGESGRWPGGGGTLIRHAAADAVGALAVAVVEATFQAPLMPSPGGPHRAAPAEHPVRRRAVSMAAITRRADGKQATATSAGLLAERDVRTASERVRGDRSVDWTTGRSNRGTTAPTGSVDALSQSSYSGGHEGSNGNGGHTGPALTPRFSDRCCRSSRLATRTSRWPVDRAPSRHRSGRRHSCGRKQPRPQVPGRVVCKTAQTRFRTATTAIIFFFIKTSTNQATGPVHRHASRIDQFEVTADRPVLRRPHEHDRAVLVLELRRVGTAAIMSGSPRRTSTPSRSRPIASRPSRPAGRALGDLGCARGAQAGGRQGVGRGEVAAVPRARNAESAGAGAARCPRSCRGGREV